MAVITKDERFDPGALSFIIDNLKKFKFRPETDTRSVLKMIKRFSASSSSSTTDHSPYACVRVSYKQIANHGRFFAVKGVSMQGMPREIRNAIAFRLQHDVDFVSCHPSLLLQFCHRHINLPCPLLEEYVADRTPIIAGLQEGASSPGAAKTAVLAVIYGGAADSPNRGIDPNNRGATWLRSFGDEMTPIREAIVASPSGAPYLEIARTSVAKKKGDGYNILGSAVNHLLCDLENDALMALRDFIENEMQRRVGCLIFDGCTVERRPSDDGVPHGALAEALQTASDYVFQRTGYRLRIAIKDMAADRLDVPVSAYTAWGFDSIPREPEYAVDDVSAARIFMQDIGPFARSCNARVFFKAGIVWTNDEAIVDKEMLARCLESNILRADTEATISGNVPTAKRVVIAAKALMPDDPTFEATLWRSNIGTTCYEDGLYDWRAKRFFAYEERPDVFPVLVVPRKFPAQRPPDALIAEVRERLLLSTLGSEDVVDTYLALMARATAGEYADKQWAIMMGERNCGKGLLQEINQAAWGPYVNTVNSGAFLLQNFASGDAAKGMSWAVDCQHKRQTYCNEVKCEAGNRAIKLDGNLLKSFQSGGDTMSGRKNYGNEREFRVATKLIMNVNDLPEVSPRDALSTVTMFKFPYKFVSQEEIVATPLPFFRLHDDALKNELCLRPDVLDAFTWLVIDAYTDHRVVPCASVLQDTKGFLEAAGDDLTFMAHCFVVTGDRKDFVLNRDLKPIFRARNVSAAIWKDRLKRMGAYPDKDCFVGRWHGAGFMCIKLVPEAVSAMMADS